MLSKNTMSLIGFLLRNPANRYNVNQLAKEVKISVGSAHKIVKTLEDKKITKSEKMANAIFYNLDLKNRESQKISEIFLMEDKNRTLSQNQIAKIYAEELKKFSAVKALVLFGSILIKKERANDVDALFIIKNKKDVEKVNNFCLEISKIKTKPIVPLIMTETDMINKLREGNSVVLEIIKTGVVLLGEDVIVEVISNAED